jgi:predicted PurR-regulated permease PerM
VMLGILGPAGAFLAVTVAAAIQAILKGTPRPALEEDGLLWG